MGERAYTLAEIDRMRAAILLMRMPKRPPNFDGATWSTGEKSPMEKYQDYLMALRAQCEDELRTCMLGGVSPEELEARTTTAQGGRA